MQDPLAQGVENLYRAIILLSVGSRRLRWVRRKNRGFSFAYVLEFICFRLWLLRRYVSFIREMKVLLHFYIRLDDENIVILKCCWRENRSGSFKAYEFDIAKMKFYSYRNRFRIEFSIGFFFRFVASARKNKAFPRKKNTFPNRGQHSRCATSYVTAIIALPAAKENYRAFFPPPFSFVLFSRFSIFPRRRTTFVRPCTPYRLFPFLLVHFFTEV